MPRLRKALPTIAFLLVAIWAVFYSDRQPRNPFDTPSVFAQQNSTLYDTIYSETLTTATTGTTQANSFQGGQSMSRAFAVEYYSDGFSGLSLQFETADRKADGTAGTWAAVPNNICSASQQPPCVIDGANPSTTTGYATFSVSAFSPFFRINVTSVTGSGHIYYRIYGYKGLSARTGKGGGAAGPTGASGPSGPAGATGASGAQGATGSTGNANGITVYSGLAGISLSGTTYFPIGGGSAANTTEASVQANVQAATTFQNFGANLSAALGGAGANSVVFTWRKNASSQTLTCTITDPATTCADTTHSFTTAAGDKIDVQAVFSGTIVATPVFVLAVQAGVTVSGPTGATGATGAAGASATFYPGNFTNASATAGYAPVWAVTSPPSTGWSWANQGSSTISSTGGYEYLDTVAAASANNLVYRYRTPPSTPYSCIVLMSGMEQGGSGAIGMGIAFSDGTKLVALRMDNDSSPDRITFDKWNSTTSYSAAYTSITYSTSGSFMNNSLPWWLKMTDDGTNLSIYRSLDGNHWVQIGSNEARGDFLTTGPTEVGYFAYNNAQKVNIAVLSWVCQ